MRSGSPYLTSCELQAHALDFLQTYLVFVPYKKLCTPLLVLRVLLCAAAWQASIAYVCGLLADAPSDQTLRNALKDQLQDFWGLERKLNRALAATCKNLRRRKAGYPLAIDLTYLPYYGKNITDDHVVTNKPRLGTKRFQAYATAYVVWRGERYTLAFTQVERKEPLADILRRLLRQARQTGVKWRYLLLDRGFYQVEAIRYLQHAREPFLMPAIIRGRQGATPEQCGGTRKFAAAKRSGFYEHRLESRNKQSATVRICAHAKNHGGKKGKHGRYVWLYAFWKLQPRSVAWVSTTYRQRFAIESSYRQMNQGRARTSTRQRGLRVLYAGLALVLRNLWVWWHWEVVSFREKNGVRRLRLGLLVLRAYLKRLADACTADLGGVKPIDLAPPKLRRRKLRT
jgi:putative transposase